MNKPDLVAAVAAKSGMTRKDAECAINAVFSVIAESLEKADKVQVCGFGAFDVRVREAREGRNPRTNEIIQIPASRTPVFFPSKKLRETVR